MIKTNLSTLFLIAASVTAQTNNLVVSEGITTPLHQASVGKVTFMASNIPIESYKESDFLAEMNVDTKSNLYIRVFMSNSLTNYMHVLAPQLSAEELNKFGNFQFSFYVDGELVYKENLNNGAFGLDNKNQKTIFRVPLFTVKSEDSWGRFVWGRFLANGGEDALSNGVHTLKIEIRPYVDLKPQKIGELIAQGEIKLNISKPVKKIDPKAIEIQPIKPNSGWEISSDTFDQVKIRELNTKIAQAAFKDITSIVVIKNGKLLIEEYFNGAKRKTLHNSRSVGKTFASAAAGIAIDEGYLKLDDSLGQIYDLKKFDHFSEKKASVKVENFLKMESGFDGFDFEEQSPGNEENMYPKPNWVEWTLSLPMAEDRNPGDRWAYFTAGIVVLGDIIDKKVPGGLEQYFDKKLFQPLEITKKEWQYTPQKVANTAGGLQLRSVDFAKFGQLYKNDGLWNGKQVLSKTWVGASFTRYHETGTNKDGYGYLFWNKSYTVGEQSYETFYCSGNGGNKIFIFKDQPLVIVVTATAYGKPYMHVQVDRMMEKYILPAVLK